MLPHVAALTVSVDGVVTVVGTTAGGVPGTAKTLNGMAVTPTGSLYVVYV